VCDIPSNNFRASASQESNIELTSTQEASFLTKSNIEPTDESDLHKKNHTSTLSRVIQEVEIKTSTQKIPSSKRLNIKLTIMDRIRLSCEKLPKYFIKKLHSLDNAALKQFMLQQDKNGNTIMHNLVLDNKKYASVLLRAVEEVVLQRNDDTLKEAYEDALLVENNKGVSPMETVMSHVYKLEHLHEYFEKECVPYVQHLLDNYSPNEHVILCLGAQSLFIHLELCREAEKRGIPVDNFIFSSSIRNLDTPKDNEDLLKHCMVYDKVFPSKEQVKDRTIIIARNLKYCASVERAAPTVRNFLNARSQPFMWDVSMKSYVKGGDTARSFLLSHSSEVKVSTVKPSKASDSISLKKLYSFDMGEYESIAFTQYDKHPSIKHKSFKIWYAKWRDSCK